MEAAHKAALAAYSIATEHDLDAPDVLRALLVVISTEVETGRMADALAHVVEMEGLLASVPDVQRVEAQWTAANVFVRNGDFVEAAERLRIALEHQDGRSDIKTWLRLRFAAASLYLQMSPQRMKDAEVLLDAADPVVSLMASAQQQVEYRALRAHLLYAKGNVRDAGRICSEIGDDRHLLGVRDRLRLEVLMNQVAILTGREDVAIPAIEALARRAQEAANIDLAADIWRTLAETLSASRLAREPTSANNG
jgi:tetratricopeptide (TPR) repeat protein